MPKLYYLSFAAFFAGSCRQKIVTYDHCFCGCIFFHKRGHILKNLQRRIGVIVPVHFGDLKLRMGQKLLTDGQHAEWDLAVMCISQYHGSGYNRLHGMDIINSRKNKLLEKHFYYLF